MTFVRNAAEQKRTAKNKSTVHAEAKASSFNDEKPKNSGKKNASDKKNTASDFFKHAQKMQDQMKNLNPFAKGGETIMDNFPKKEDFPKIDREKIINLHKKNMEALNNANGMAVDVMRQISELQGQFMKQTFEQIDAVIRENLAFKNPSPQEQISKNTKHMKNAMERAVGHANSFSKIMLKSNQDLFKSVQNRFEEGMQEMQCHINKTKH